MFRARNSPLFSCRDGLKKPPPLTKRRIETAFPVSNNKMSLASTSQFKLKAPVEKSHEKDKPDQRIEQLESLHKRNGVTSGLQIPDGKRIKLDYTNKLVAKSSARSSKPKPNFDIEFSKVDAIDDLDWGVTEFAPLSDEDIPSVRDVMEKSDGKKKRVNLKDSDSIYGDSEVDTFIREMATPPSILVRSATPHSVPYRRYDNSCSPCSGRGKKRQNDDRCDEMRDPDDVRKVRRLKVPIIQLPVL
jgi:hypothetical protein